jgi:hypothetical protein
MNRDAVGVEREQGVLSCPGHVRDDFTASEEVSGRIISPPVHPYLSAGGQGRIAFCLTELPIAEI